MQSLTAWASSSTWCSVLTRSPIPAFGTYDQERLYILRTLDQLEIEVRQLSEDAAVDREGKLAKAEKDVHALGAKVRTLENQRSMLTIKEWIKTSLLTGAGVVLIELAHFLLSHH